VLNQLQQHARGRFGRVIIIDEVATRNAHLFDHQVGFTDDYQRVILDGDLLDAAIWSQVGDIVEMDGHEPVVILGSGRDGTNLHASLLVRRQHPAAYVIVRSFMESPFTGEIAREAGVHTFSLAGLIEDGMPEAWFD